MRPVAAEQEARPHLLLGTGRRDDPADHSVLVLCEPHQLGAPLDPAAEAGELLLDDPLRLVLRESREAVGHLWRQPHLEAILLHAVVVQHMPAHRHGYLESGADHTHPVPDLQGPRLYAHGLGVRQPGRKSVDDTAGDPLPPQFRRRGQPDGSRTHDQYVRVHHRRLPPQAPLAARLHRPPRGTGQRL